MTNALDMLHARGFVAQISDEEGLRRAVERGPLTLYQGFDDPKFRPSPLLKQMCHAGYLGRKKGRGFFTYPAA